MSEVEVPFKASVSMPSQKSIAIEHLELCQGCTQRSCAHAVGVGEVYGDSEIQILLDEAKNAAKFASDATQLNRDLIQKVNDLMIVLSDQVTKFLGAVDKLKAEEKVFAKGEIGRWANYGKYVGAGFGMVLTFLGGLAI